MSNPVSKPFYFSPAFTISLSLALLYVLFSFLILPGWSPYSIRGLNAPVAPVADLSYMPLAKKGEKTEIVDLNKVFTATPDMIKKGQEIFGKTCAACHGEKGFGDGPAGKSLSPSPRNFTKSAGWKNGYKVSNIFRTISMGINGTSMASYDYLPQIDRFSLAHYVRSLGKFDHGSDDTYSISALSKEFFLTESKNESNKVPINIIIEEMSVKTIPDCFLKLPENSDNSPLAEILRSSILDPNRVDSLLKESSYWRNNVSSFTKMAIYGAPANGFSPSIAKKSSEDLQMLYAYLLTMYKIEKGEKK